MFYISRILFAAILFIPKIQAMQLQDEFWEIDLEEVREDYEKYEEQIDSNLKFNIPPIFDWDGSFIAYDETKYHAKFIRGDYYTFPLHIQSGEYDNGQPIFKTEFMGMFDRCSGYSKDFVFEIKKFNSATMFVINYSDFDLEVLHSSFVIKKISDRVPPLITFNLKPIKGPGFGASIIQGLRMSFFSKCG